MMVFWSLLPIYNAFCEAIANSECAMRSPNSQNPVWFPVGDQALMLDFTGFTPVLESADAPAAHQASLKKTAAQIAGLARHITAHKIEGITDIVPSLSRLLISFDSAIITPAIVKQTIILMLDGPFDEAQDTARHWSLPVCYDDDCGPDIAEIATRTNLSADEVIARHLACELEVSVMGFMPGLGYMTGVDERLSLPRRANPRTVVPERSVGLAIGQCVIYPLTSPGGWHLIGRTSFPLFDPQREAPILLRTGDKVRFWRITPDELMAQERAYHCGQFTAQDLCRSAS